MEGIQEELKLFGNFLLAENIKKYYLYAIGEASFRFIFT